MISGEFSKKKFVERLNEEAKRLGKNLKTIGDESNIPIYLYTQKNSKIPRADTLAKLSIAGIDLNYVLTGQSNKTTGAPLGANLVKDKQEEYRRELFELKEQIKSLTQRVEKYETDNTILRNLLALLLKENLSLEAKNMILSVLNSQIENPNVKIKEAPG